jgi:hypothetical protein
MRPFDYHAAEHFDCVTHLAVTAGASARVGLGLPDLRGALCLGQAEGGNTRSCATLCWIAAEPKTPVIDARSRENLLMSLRSRSAR